MPNIVEYTQVMWKPRKSHGPDVEMIIYIPIVVAVESKLTVDVALKEIGQVIKYARTRLYDAVLIRLEHPPADSNAGLRTLIDVAEQHGIGIILGGSTYAPLTGSEQVIAKALLGLQGDPVLLYRRRGGMNILSKRADNTEDQLKDLSHFRKYFLLAEKEKRGVIREG